MLISEPALTSLKQPAASLSLDGLDLLRGIGVLLVTTQHVLSLLAHDSWTHVYSVNIGQLGVSLFLGISAHLACISQRPPIAWLGRRLSRVFPAYWIAILLSYLLATLVSHKSLSFAAFMKQMLGLGLWVSQHQLVNTPTWFISLLLICYVGAFIGRLSRHPIYVDLMIAVLAALWIRSGFASWPMEHVLTFFVVTSIVTVCSFGRISLVYFIVGLLLIIGWRVSSHVSYTGITLLLMACFYPLPYVTRQIRRFSEYYYEYYLVHGVFLYGSIQVFRDRPVIAVILGISLAGTIALVIHTVVERAMNGCTTMRTRFARFASRAFEG